MAESRRGKVCTYCENYMKGLPCDFKDNCYLYKLQKENKALKIKNKQLRLKINSLEDEQNLQSWGNSNRIGDVHEMGCC